MTESIERSKNVVNDPLASTVYSPCGNCENLNVELQQLRQTLKKVLHVFDETRTELSSLRYEIHMHHNSTTTYGELFAKSCKVCLNSIDVGLYDTHICRDGATSICCEYCLETFESIAEVMDHSYIYHDGDQIYRCQDCSMAFDMSALYMFHMEAVHRCSNSNTSAEAEIEIKTEAIEVDPIIMIKQEPIDSILEEAVEASEDIVSATAEHSKLELKKRAIKKVDLESRGKKWKISSYKCHVCEKVLTTKEAMELHLQRVHKLKVFVCEMCGRTFKYERSLKSHMQEKHGLEGYPCKICRRTYKGVKTLQRHIELAHEKKDEKALNGTSRQQEADPDEACVNVPDEPQYKCFADDLPPLTNERESTLTPMEHKPEAHQCRKCDQIFTDVKTLKRHEKSEHGETARRPDSNTRKPRFECYLCKKQFTKKWYSQEHLRKQHTQHRAVDQCAVCNVELASDEGKLHSCDGLKLDCEYCAKAFKTLKTLMTHLNGEHVEKLIYVCEVCRRPFHMRTFLDLHKTKHTRGCFSCQLCAETFDTKAQKERHSRYAHPKIGTHLCDQCGKSFTKKDLLMHHKALHVNKDIKCEKCPFTTNEKRNLKHHMLRKHQPPTTMYSCNLCGKKIGTSQAFSKHMRRHTRTEADRKYSCSMCPKKFFANDAARRHMQSTHSAIRAYQCTYCDKAYKHSGDLTKHLRIHLGDDMYKCPECPEAFRLPWDLERHSYKHYEEQAANATGATTSHDHEHS